MTIFQKIINRDIPAHIIYEDDVKVMSHLEKEAYIESRESSW